MTRSDPTPSVVVATAVAATAVVATANPHKLNELRAMLADLPLRLLGLRDLATRIEMPEETGATFQANADLKAIQVAQASGMWALADDSGFEVPALGDRPGVISARYSGATGTQEEIDIANNRKLVAEASGAGLFRGPEAPSARFRCVLSLAAPDGRVLCRGEGSCPGHLVEEARGSAGFGYDPHFLVPEFGRTFAELGPEEKNSISHRARALADLRRSLEPLLASPRTKPTP
ncbi:MAG: RdgB/HAM1 family non-canonical purine NTP pyrophosphatase [Planctomycetes bacterium]|nr:RdgB/HAM1 family non-canonical purine NTP pyrophosphatase [Planctomycetota bacterium]